MKLSMGKERKTRKKRMERNERKKGEGVERGKAQILYLSIWLFMLLGDEGQQFYYNVNYCHLFL